MYGVPGVAMTDDRLARIKAQHKAMAEGQGVHTSQYCDTCHLITELEQSRARVAETDEALGSTSRGAAMIDDRRAHHPVLITDVVGNNLWYMEHHPFFFWTGMVLTVGSVVFGVGMMWVTYG